MISLHNVSGADQALHYFSKDNYYTEDQGLAESAWFGQGAQTLGLVGRIEKEAFFAALQGEFAGQQLGRTVKDAGTGEVRKEHRPGIDMTFSAPKSVSILAEVGGFSEVRQAHEQAVQVALSYVEKELAATRQMAGGELSDVTTGNLTVAMFRHNTSRNLDPQTHTHAIIMNATRREDGQWRSLTNEALYEEQRVIGAIYNAELASRLQSLGYQLERTDAKGNFEVVGVSREQIESFSSRRAEIAAGLKARGIDIDDASAQQKETAALATRAKKTEVDHVALVHGWREQAAKVGIDLSALKPEQGKARVTAEEQLKRAPASARAAVDFAFSHLVEREAVHPKADVLQKAIEHGIGKVGPAAVLSAFAALEKEGVSVRLPDGQYTTAKMLNSEQWALRQVRETAGTAGKILGKEAVAEILGELEARQGFAYTAGQREAITLAASADDRFVAVEGLAGTGKTTALRGLREVAARSGYALRGMAPSGAAAKVLGRETGIEATTVALFESRERRLQHDLKLAAVHAPEFTRQKELWVVDESGMLSQTQLGRLQRLALNAGARVVFVGDTKQLQAVEAGKPYEMAQREGMQTARMTEINRQKTVATKAVVAAITGQDQLLPGERLRSMELAHNARAFGIMVKSGMVHEVKGASATSEVIARVAKLSPQERGNTIVITPYNEDRKAINQGVRQHMREAGELTGPDILVDALEPKGLTKAQQSHAQYFESGDVVRFGRAFKTLGVAEGQYATVSRVDQDRGVVVLSKPDGGLLQLDPQRFKSLEVYTQSSRSIAAGDSVRLTRGQLGLANGQTAQVLAIKAGVARLQLGDGRQLAMDLDKNRHWDHAYASTVHAAQGSTAKRALMYIPTPEGDAGPKEDRELAAMAKIFGSRSLYVGATRPTHELIVVTNNLAKAQKAVTGQQEKTSAVESIRKFQPLARGIDR